MIWLALILNPAAVRKGWARGKREHQWRRFFRDIDMAGGRMSGGPWTFTATVTYRHTGDGLELKPVRVRRGWR